MVRSAIIVLFLWLLVPLQEKVSDPYDLAKQTKFGHTIWMPSQIERARIMSQLQQIPGRHIVFVHFHRTDIGGIFWIYNEPDVANSKIIWAHDMGSDANQEFMRLYGNRKSWIVDKDDILMQLLPYSPAPAPSDSVLATYKFHKTNAQ